MEWVTAMLDLLSPALAFIKDWNFLVPVAIWVYVQLKRTLRRRKLRARLWSSTAISRGEVRLISEVSGEPARLAIIGSMEEAQALQVLRDLALRTGVDAVAHLERPVDPSSPQSPELLVLVGSGGPGSPVENIMRSFDESFAFTARGFKLGGTEFSASLVRRANGVMDFDSEVALIASGDGGAQKGRRLIITSRYAHSVLRLATAISRDPGVFGERITDPKGPWNLVCEWDNRRDRMTLVGSSGVTKNTQIEGSER